MNRALLCNQANWMDQLVSELERGQLPERTSYLPPVDIVEEKDAFQLRIELPGVKREDLNVEVKENRLTLSGKKDNVWQEHKDGYRYFETRHGTFTRSFELPRNVKSEAIEAKYADGILTLTIPKAEAAVSKTVKVQ
jgi:HSP20 family protein